jgi:hypothetical protein
LTFFTWQHRRPYATAETNVKQRQGSFAVSTVAATFAATFIATFIATFSI